jgi:hypothetical protein
VGIGAQGQYIRPTPADPTLPPTDSDLVVREGIEKTVVVQIINLTPYDIQLKDTNVGGPISLTASSLTANDQQEMMDTNRQTPKSFMFAPVGIPRFIPKTPDQAFEPPTIPCSPNSTQECPNPNYDPNYYNTQTRMYSMVFSWDDRQEYVAHSWVRWTIKNVQYCVTTKDSTCEGTYYQDVDLGLWLDRIQPTTPTGSGYFSLVSGSTFAAFHTLGLIVEWENPLAWIEEAISAAELAKGITEFKKENGAEAEDDDGAKMFLASYTIPTESTATTPGSLCGSGPAARVTCWPSGLAPVADRDAVDSTWPVSFVSLADGTGAGPAFVEVSTQLLRGLPAPECPAGPTSSKTCDLGRVPIFTITVMRPGDWQAAKFACLTDPDSTCGMYTPTTAAAVASASSASVTDSSASFTNPIFEQIRQFLLQAGAGRIRAALDRFPDRRAGLDRFPDRRAGVLALAAIIRGLPTTDWQVLHDMVGHALAGEQPTHQERDLVHLIGADLEQQLKGKER